MASRVAMTAAFALLAGCLFAALCGAEAFVGQPAGLSSQRVPTLQRLRARPAEFGEHAASSSEGASAVTSVLAGVCLGLLAFFASPGQASAGEVSDIVIPVDGKGKTTTLDKEQLIRGKRLFNQACVSCHVAGATRTNQNVGLALEELTNAVPARNTVESLIDYMKSPTTYDGLTNISEVHPSVQAGDIWPMMRTMRQQDLYDMSAYILYQTQNIPEKWGGGKIYY